MATLRYKTHYVLSQNIMNQKHIIIIDAWLAWLESQKQWGLWKYLFRPKMWKAFANINPMVFFILKNFPIVNCFFGNGFFFSLKIPIIKCFVLKHHDSRLFFPQKSSILGYGAANSPLAIISAVTNENNQFIRNFLGAK